MKRPMDLGTVEKKLFEEGYSMENFREDVCLVWENAMTFNPPSHPVHEMAVLLKQLFQSKFERVVKMLTEKISRPKSSPKSKPEKRHRKNLKFTKPKPKHKNKKGGKHDKLDAEVRKLAQKMERMRKRLQGLQTNTTKQKSNFKKKKKSKPKSRGTDSADQVSWTERQVLKQQIIELPPEDLNGVAEIVRDSMPEDADSAEVITKREIHQKLILIPNKVEVDLETLKSSTIRRLQQYVKDCNSRLPSKEDDENSSEDSSSDSD